MDFHSYINDNLLENIYAINYFDKSKDKEYIDYLHNQIQI